jgi:NAD(P)-dependent dehydrogenase (short-subunit alcohol dehydrogenase family)
MERLTNKTALITGGTTGIGRAVAEDFIKEGAKVIITGREQKTLERAVIELGSNASGFILDNASMKDILTAKNKTTEIFDKIDILFANAGYGKFAPIEATSEEMFDELFQGLVKGTYFTIKELVPIINSGGSIIMTTSVVTEYGSENASVYSAAKAAVQSLTRTLAAELVSKNIRVNAVSPGYTNTEAFKKTGMSDDQIAGAKQYIAGTLPFKRFAEASEIAKAVTFLATDDASYLHGSEIVVDGGYSVLR